MIQMMMQRSRLKSRVQSGVGNSRKISPNHSHNPKSRVSPSHKPRRRISPSNKPRRPPGRVDVKVVSALHFA